MLIPNPYRHYPRFSAQVILKDGTVNGCRGVAETENLGIPWDEDDIVAIALTILDSGNNPVTTKILIDGKWKEYDKELWECCKIVEIEEEVEEEVELKQEIVAEVVSSKYEEVEVEETEVEETEVEETEVEETEVELDGDQNDNAEPCDGVDWYKVKNSGKKNE